MRRIGNRLMAGPYVIWMTVFTIIPLLLIFYYALTDGSGSFTLDNVAAIADPVNGKPLLRSIGMSALVTLACLLLAYPLAVILRRYSRNKNSLIVMAFIMPMWMNFMLRTLAWRLIFLNNGFLNRFLSMLGLPPLHLMNTLAAVVFCTAYDYFPFMVLPIYNSLVKIDEEVVHAAQDLGAGSLTILRRIILPLSLPGIVSGVTMVFVPSMSEFVIAAMMGGGKVYLIGNVIEQAFNSGYANVHLGSGLSVSLMGMIAVSLLLYRFADKGEGEHVVW